MMKKSLLAGLGIAVLALPALALAPKSGLAKGEQISAYHPTHVTGPLADSTKCFPCTFKSAPQVQVFVNGDDLKNVAAIATMLQKQTEKYTAKGFKAMVVFLAPEAQQASLKPILKEAAKSTGAKDVAMALIDPKHEAIADYKINTSAEVKNTVIVYKNWTVSNTMVNFKADEDGKKALKAAIAEITK